MTDLMQAYTEGGAILIIISLFGFMFYKQQKKVDKLDKDRYDREAEQKVLLKESHSRETEYQDIVKQANDISIQQNDIIKAMSNQLPHIRQNMKSTNETIENIEIILKELLIK